jgi:hypothetical protein
MVLQYRIKRQKRWKKYPGKDKIKVSLSKLDFRLLTEDKKRVLSEGSYSKVLRRFRQVEFFKHRK